MVLVWYDLIGIVHGMIYGMVWQIGMVWYDLIGIVYGNIYGMV